MPSLAPVMSAHVPFFESVESCPPRQHTRSDRVFGHLGERTLIPGNTNKLAIMRQNDKILSDSQTTPINAKMYVVGDT